ncbi:MAG: ribonuclease III [Lachnospiraceae bacterium]|nr:ribonuclease III [Lachnospiraceae bacterium]
MNELSFNNIKNVFNIEDKDIKTISPLVFAYVGDSVYDLIIKSILVARGNIPVNNLHKKASSLVKAEAQVRMYNAVKDILDEDEQSVFRRGRNAKSYTTAKNATKIDYRMATGYEALIGYLYMEDKIERIYQLVSVGLKEVEEDGR